MLARILDSRPQSSACQREQVFVAKIEVSGKSIRKFEGEANLSEIGLGFSGL